MKVATQDPAKTDPEKYKVILESERVRVFEYRDKPGEKTSLHYHQDFVIYALSSFKRKLVLADGKEMKREFNIGEVAWMKEQTHIGINIGKTETHALIVELKEVPKGQTENSSKLQ